MQIPSFGGFFCIGPGDPETMERASCSRGCPALLWGYKTLSQSQGAPGTGRRMSQAPWKAQKLFPDLGERAAPHIGNRGLPSFWPTRGPALKHHGFDRPPPLPIPRGTSQIPRGAITFKRFSGKKGICVFPRDILGLYRQASKQAPTAF